MSPLTPLALIIVLLVSPFYWAAENPITAALILAAIFGVRCWWRRRDGALRRRRPF